MAATRHLILLAQRLVQLLQRDGATQFDVEGSSTELHEPQGGLLPKLGQCRREAETVATNRRSV